MRKRRYIVRTTWVLLTTVVVCSVLHQCSQLRSILASMEKNQYDLDEEEVQYGEEENLVDGGKNISRESKSDKHVDILYEKNEPSPKNNLREEHEEDEECLSPEKNSTWILDGACSEEQHISSFSTGETRTCGLCGKQSEYLRSLRDDIANRFQNQCKDLVVYGAALGQPYEDWLQDPGSVSERASEVVERHGTCFFQFILDYNNTGYTHSIDGSQNLIVVKEEWLPYQNNRRNVKLLKFNPGLFFPWADRIIWQDTKLLHPKYTMPSNYALHFNRTVQYHGTCSSYMGLPRHTNTVGRRASSTTSLQSHCNAIIAAAEKRPSVSDNLDVLRTQCDRYIGKHSNSNLTSSQVFHQDPLVDSAFIVYDMRISACREFIGDFGCSWLNEIHCYSDRDQISFPHILASSGMKKSPKMELRGQEFRDRIYVNEENIPMVHIAKRSCHWYYGSFPRCLASMAEDSDVTSKEKANKSLSLVREKGKRRVAVIVAGTMRTFIFQPTLKNFAASMLKEGTSVDYYVSLTTATDEALRSGSQYTEYLQPDPSLPESTLHDHADFEEYLRTIIEPYKGFSLATITIEEKIDIDSDPLLEDMRKKARESYPDEDPDHRFPLFDMRGEGSKHHADLNRNFLSMHLAIQNLWTVATKFEAEEDFTYDYVIFMRGDSLWLNRFRISTFDAKGGDIFVPSCDARDPPMDSHELNDHLLISRRGTADIFGNYYSTLFETDISACMEQLPVTLNKNGKRGCNSEMLLKWVATQHKLDTILVSQSDVPFQRSANIRLSDGSNKQCFHKFCQSQSKPLILNQNDNLEMCKNIIFKDRNDT